MKVLTGLLIVGLFSTPALATTELFSTELFSTAPTTSDNNIMYGDIVFMTGDGVEILRFKPGGVVVANPNIKPDKAAKLVLSAIYEQAPSAFCKNPLAGNSK